MNFLIPLILYLYLQDLGKVDVFVEEMAEKKLEEELASVDVADVEGGSLEDPNKDKKE